MSTKDNSKLTVINGKKEKFIEKTYDYNDSSHLHSNPIYEKLLNFRNLQEAQKKRFSVDDLFKLC